MEVAKEVFEIKRRSTLHSVVQRSFPLYAPDVVDPFLVDCAEYPCTNDLRVMLFF